MSNYSLFIYKLENTFFWKIPHFTVSHSDHGDHTLRAQLKIACRKTLYYWNLPNQIKHPLTFPEQLSICIYDSSIEEKKHTHTKQFANLQRQLCFVAESDWLLHFDVRRMFVMLLWKLPLDFFHFPDTRDNDADSIPREPSPVGRFQLVWNWLHGLKWKITGSLSLARIKLNIVSHLLNFDWTLDSKF